MDSQELQSWLRLSMTPTIGNETAQQLLQALGSVEAIFEQSAACLSSLVTPRQAQALQVAPQDLSIQFVRTEQWLGSAPQGQGRTVWVLGGSDYPQAFYDLSNPPLMVYAQGQLDACRPPMLAVVGSRNPTAQGAQIARDLSQALTEYGVCIVSGLALGIDGAAHTGALETASPLTNHWRTVAIVGTGLDRVYPRQHHALAHQVCQQGVMLSEFHLGHGPLTHHFPMRNRLIAALGLATLVVEAAPESGSLITAEQALELGRDVMAVPGSIYSTHAKGCHQLIRQGAKLIETARDVLEELPSVAKSQLQPTESSKNQLVQINDDPLLTLMDFAPVSLDELQLRSGFDIASLQTQLLGLELSGAISRMPGGLFQRLRNV